MSHVVRKLSGELVQGTSLHTLLDYDRNPVRQLRRGTTHSTPFTIIKSITPGFHVTYFREMRRAIRSARSLRPALSLTDWQFCCRFCLRRGRPMNYVWRCNHPKGLLWNLKREAPQFQPDLRFGQGSRRTRQEVGRFLPRRTPRPPLETPEQ